MTDLLTIPALRAQQEAQARELVLERAHRIATTAAEELIRSEGEHLGEDDTFGFALCQLDDHTRDCIGHLVATGQAAAHETEDGYMLVHLLSDDLEGLPL